MDKEKLKEIVNEFVVECKRIEEERPFRREIKPSFDNFIRWINGKTWNME